MKIVYVSPFVPWPLNRGVNRRVYHFLMYLAKRHDVHFVAISTNQQEAAYLSEFDQHCASVQFVQADMKPWQPLYKRIFHAVPDIIKHWRLSNVEKVLNDIVTKGNFDLIYCADICMTQYFTHLHPACPVVTDRHRVDVELEMEHIHHIHGWKERINRTENIIKLQLFEKQILDAFHYQVVSRKEDFAFLRDNFGVMETLAVIENGVDESHFRPMNTEPNPLPTLVFTGSLDYYPNRDGVLWFLADIRPRILRQFGDFRFVIVGIGADSELEAIVSTCENVTLISDTTDVRPYYAMADVYVAPLRAGAGSSMKVIEAAAMHSPVVATRHAITGYEYQPGVHLLTAESSEAFAEATISLLQDSGKANALADAAHLFTLEHYTWSTLGKKLDEFLHFCVQHHYEHGRRHK